MNTNDRAMTLSNWKFQIDQEDAGESFGWQRPEYDRGAWMDVAAPGPWDFYAQALRGYEGAGWYATRVSISREEGVRHILEFTGAGGRTRVWVNGHPAGSNGIRYLPFSFDVSEYLHPGKDNVIAVKVDNSFQGDRHLTGGTKIEWVLYGGLTHRIRLLTVPACRIAHVEARCDHTGGADVTVTVRNDGAADFSGTVALTLDTARRCRAEAPVRCEAGKTLRAAVSLRAEAFTPWSPDRPMLYTLTAALLDGTEQRHTARERVGFRTIECRDNRILLNEKPIFLKGVNRYDEYHPYGTSVPEPLIRQDLERIKDSGVNLIRVHYPQDPVHLEIADELGLMYMLEVPLNWWFPKDEETLDDYSELRDEAVETMDRTYPVFCNHPSWVVWSMSNECENHNAASSDMLRMLAARARAMRCGRLITNVAHQMPEGGELDYCDFVGFNRYHGADKPVESMAQLERYITGPVQKDLGRLAELYPDKPIVICEFGAVSVIGLHGESRMSEERHAEMIRLTHRAILGCSHICGTILWAWADYFHNRCLYGTVPGGMHINATFGPYGVVTVDRRVKEGPYRALLDIFNPQE